MPTNTGWKELPVDLRDGWQVRWAAWNPWPQRHVWSGMIGLLDPGEKRSPKVVLIERDRVIQALSSQRSQNTLADDAPCRIGAVF